jgi:hypothetical protein
VKENPVTVGKIALFGAWLLAALPGLAGAQAPRPDPAPAPAAASTLYVIRRGWHLDVGFAAGALGAPLTPVLDALPGARFLVFGFGDRHYLLAAHRHAPDLIAALWPGPGVLLVTGLIDTPEAAFGAAQVIRLPLTPAAATAAQAFIRRSLSETRVLARGPYAGSVFFASTARYSAAHTCNTWIAELLAQAGLPVRTRAVVFAGPLWRRVGVLSRGAWSHPSTRPTTPTAPRPSSCSAAEGCCC